MQYMQENIEFTKDIPIIIGIKNLSDIPRHWHNRIEIFLVLSGNMKIIVESETYHLSEDDIILVNSNQVHEIQGNDNVSVVLQINYAYFKKWLDETSFFQCNSTVYHNKMRFVELKRLIAQLIYVNYNETERNDLLAISLAYQLILELIKNFKSYDNNPMNQNSKHLTRLRTIIQYLNSNYTENITLEQVAEREFLSPSYLSHFFKINMGVSFFNYLTGIRMNHAVNDLLSTNLTMEQIAANNGFANSRYFVDCFKKKFGVLPKEYRREHKKETAAKSNSDPKALYYKGYLLMEQVDYLNKLGEYLDTKIMNKSTNIIKSVPVRLIEVNTTCCIKNLTHNFKTFTGVGRAKELLLERVQSELRTLQKEVGFKYVKFHGILDDSMMLYNEDRHGNPYLTYTYIDEVMDFLMSIRLKPLIQFSFMPRLLAKDPTNTIFYNPVILSEPNNYSNWEFLITQLTMHFIERYGIDEVRTWFFSFWNVPFQSYIFSFSSDEIAYELYKLTWSSVKKCDNQLKFGTPSYGSISFFCDEYYDFLDYCKENNCYPDFYNIHCYPVKTSTTKGLATLGEDLLDNGDGDKIILSEDPDYMSKSLESLKMKLTSYPKLPIYITEWASTSAHRDWLNDTCYRSSYIIKNILENYDEVGSFGNWCLSDTLEELPFDNEVFHGELGLFTYNGIKKPAYYAFTFLNKLMDTLIERGNGYFITTNQKGDYAILLYNYIHMSPLYTQGVLFNVTFLERYNAFVSSNTSEFDFALSHVANGKYTLTEHIVNREHGSAFDEWVRMGAIPLTTEEEVNTLNGHSMPQITKMNIEVNSNYINYFAELKPHEIRLVLIKKHFIS
jgi:xylan 1,4-beta-xylosidase